jgi:hypothetical protein
MLESIPWGDWLPIILAIIALGVLWTILRFVINMVKKIFWYGCLTIVVAGTLWMMATLIVTG